MSDFLNSSLPYLKLILVFTAMLVGVRRKLGLGLSALGGSLLLALLFGLSPLRWLELGLEIFTDRSILAVWGVIVLVLSLSSLMELTGQAERFMAALAHKITSPMLRMVFFPILIGLLPMPGGAVFSAPMINAVAKDLHVAEEDKSLINYWFRHSAEMSWPLFPALILASGMAGLSTPQLVLWTMPMSAVFLLVGWLFFVRPLKVASPPPMADSGQWTQVCKHGAPIFVALAGALFFEVLFAYFLPQRPMDEGVLVALTLAVLLCLRQNGLGGRALVQALSRPSVRSMIFIVGALGVFKNVLVGGGVVSVLMAKGSGLVALWLTATLLPMLVSALTGLLIASVGATFPLLIVLAQTVDGGAHLVQWLALGLASGLTGSMISPLHICFVLSCEYFNVDLGASWRRLPAPCVLFFLCGVAYFFIIRQV